MANKTSFLRPENHLQEISPLLKTGSGYKNLTCQHSESLINSDGSVYSVVPVIFSLNNSCFFKKKNTFANRN